MSAIRGRSAKLNAGGFSDQLFRSIEVCRRWSIGRRMSSVDESFNGGRGRREEVRTEREGGGQNPPNPSPNRQLRGGRRSEIQSQGAAVRTEGGGVVNGSRLFDRERGGGGRNRAVGDEFGAKRMQSSSLEFLKKPLRYDDDKKFLDKFKFGENRKEKTVASMTLEIPEVSANVIETKPEDADAIFKKMKENGLIPNAVAMLDGLCKDGLVQEAMKLFKLMREKGQMPEVVIYTAVVEGFCKAHKCDDAKRIFRKMQSSGIVPNAYSYTVLIQGLLRCVNVDDAVEFSLEMLEAGHSPNLVTFLGLVDVVANEKGVEEAKKVMNSLREKGYFVDEKAVRIYLDKKSPALPLVWEVVLGKKTHQGLF